MLNVECLCIVECKMMNVKCEACVYEHFHRPFVPAGIRQGGTFSSLNDSQIIKYFSQGSNIAMNEFIIQHLLKSYSRDRHRRCVLLIGRATLVATGHTPHAGHSAQSHPCGWEATNICTIFQVAHGGK